MGNLTTDIVLKALKQGHSVIEIAKKYRVTRQTVYWHINKKKKKKKKECKKKKEKKNYNVLRDWKVYNEGLVKRGEFLLDFDIFYDWAEDLKSINEDKKGRPFEYPDSFILFFLRLKCMFKIDYRTLEGIARKLVVFIPQANKAPDYTTFHVRAEKLKIEIEVYQRTAQQEIAGDSSGLKTSNRGEYRISKYHGRKKKFVKLHLGVNTETKQVIFCEVTEEQIQDVTKLAEIVSHGSELGEIITVYFDGGYDSKNNHQILEEKGIIPVIRPRRTMSLKKVREKIRQLKEKGRRDIRAEMLEEFLRDEEKWKEKYGYGKRWAVEDRYSVFKRLFSEHVFSKKMENIKKEVIIKVNLMNLFTYLTKSKEGYHNNQEENNSSIRGP